MGQSQIRAQPEQFSDLVRFCLKIKTLKRVGDELSEKTLHSRLHVGAKEKKKKGGREGKNEGWKEEKSNSEVKTRAEV